MLPHAPQNAEPVEQVESLASEQQTVGHRPLAGHWRAMVATITLTRVPRYADSEGRHRDRGQCPVLCESMINGFYS
jgi:hypothetical protein